MNGNSLACDDQLLLAMLREELPGDDSDALLDHVEACAHCQQRLSDLAAPGEDWRRATDAMWGAVDPAGKSLSFDLPTVHQHPTAWTESMGRQLLSPPSHPEMLGRLGRYEVERLIGSGGMGIVFKAFDTELNRPVAIKLLAPYLAGSGPARRRFAREARAAAAVVHQHVIPIHNVETEGELPYIVMQYISGESLQDRIDREGSLELCEILRIGMQVADGLAAAHQQGLVHRDIKPANIMLEEDVDKSLITDFGLARAVDDASLTRAGFHPGTPQYMSPEQASGHSVDARSDLFSLGSVLYTMCTGRPPFRADNSLSVMRRISEEEATSIREINPTIPDWLCTLIAKLMAKGLPDRLQTARSVCHLLEACLSHVQQPSNSLPKILEPTNQQRYSPTLKNVTGAIAMVSFLVVIWFVCTSPADKPQEQPVPAGEQTSPQASEQPGIPDNAEVVRQFERLYRMQIAVSKKNNSIVQTIQDEATAQQAANEVVKLFPLRAEIRYLKRALRDFGVGPDQKLFDQYKQQSAQLANQYVMLAIKKKDQPYFERFNTAYVEMSVKTTTLKPYPIPEGHAQRGDGPQFVVWLPPGAMPQIDLSSDEGRLEICLVDEKTGELRPQRETITCGGKALLPMPDRNEGSLYWLRPVNHKEAADSDADQTESAPRSEPLTWKSLLGTEPPEGYTTESLSLIEALNKSRGEWMFSGKIRRDGEESEFEATMEVQGGFKKMLRQGSFPQWQIAIAWPRENPTESLALNVMTLPEPDGIKLMLIPGYSSKSGDAAPGRHKMYGGTWDAAKSTAKWTPRRVQLPGRKSDSAPPVNDEADAFELMIKPNGQIQLVGYQHNESIRISGQTAARVGKPYVEEELALERLPNGYKVFFASRLEVNLVTKTGAGVAGPRIEKIGCDGNLIFGLIATYKRSRGTSDKPGYFWLESTTGETSKGMELAAWREALRSKGVSEPRLFSPESVGEQY